MILTRQRSAFQLETKEALLERTKFGYSLFSYISPSPMEPKVLVFRRVLRTTSWIEAKAAFMELTNR